MNLGEMINMKCIRNYKEYRTMNFYCVVEKKEDKEK